MPDKNSNFHLRFVEEKKNHLCFCFFSDYSLSIQKKKENLCFSFGLEKLNFCWCKMVGGGESGKWVSVKFNATKRDDDSQRRPMENCFICTTNWVKNSENWRRLLSQDAAQHPQFLGEHLQTNNLGIETIWVKWKKNQRKV